MIVRKPSEGRLYFYEGHEHALIPLTDMQIKSATYIVASHSADVDYARKLLAILGLVVLQKVSVNC